MGYTSNSQNLSDKDRSKQWRDRNILDADKTIGKFNKRIAKKTRRTQNQHKGRHYERQYNRKQNNHTKWRAQTKVHCGYRRHSFNSQHRQFMIPFSPEYQPSSPAIIMKPLSYSDEYKPQTLQQGSEMQSYSGYINGLMLLKMQREEQRSQELIERLGRITFAEGDSREQV